MVEMKLLTDAAVRNLKPGKTERLIRDAGAQSLFLHIAARQDGDKRNPKSWRTRFRGIDGKPTKIKLGPFDVSGHELKETPEIGQPLTVKGARALMTELHRRRARGEDVSGEHKARKIRRRTEVAEKATLAFGVCAVEFIRSYRTKKHHTRPRRWFEYAHVLGLHWPRDCDPTKVEPEVIKGGLAERWANRDVREIDEADIIAIVEAARDRGIPGLDRHNGGISENRGRNAYAVLSMFFGWLQARRRVTRNVCRDVHHAGPPPARERTLSENELRWLWRALEAEPLYGPLVKLLMLSGQRLNECAGLRVGELSDDRALWTIPNTRTKNHREHVVPLAPLARELLGDIEISGDRIFSTTGTTPVSGWNRLKRRLDRRMAEFARQDRGVNGGEIPAWRLHDLRRTFVTGLGDLGIRPDVIELAVNHVSGHRGGVAGTYNKSTLLPERTEAFKRWAVHLAGIVEAKPANVTRMKQVRRGNRR